MPLHSMGLGASRLAEIRKDSPSRSRCLSSELAYGCFSSITWWPSSARYATTVPIDAGMCSIRKQMVSPFRLLPQGHLASGAEAAAAEGAAVEAAAAEAAAAEAAAAEASAEALSIPTSTTSPITSTASPSLFAVSTSTTSSAPAGLIQHLPCSPGDPSSDDMITESRARWRHRLARQPRGCRGPMEKSLNKPRATPRGPTANLGTCRRRRRAQGIKPYTHSWSSRRRRSGKGARAHVMEDALQAGHAQACTHRPFRAPTGMAPPKGQDPCHSEGAACWRGRPA
jgi:hypothetical protein